MKHQWAIVTGITGLVMLTTFTAYRLSQKVSDVTVKAISVSEVADTLVVQGRADVPDGFLVRVSACRPYVSKRANRYNRFIYGWSCPSYSKIANEQATVRDQRFEVAISVSSVEGARRLQARQADVNQDSAMLQSEVPADFISLSVSGLLESQPETIQEHYDSDKFRLFRWKKLVPDEEFK